MGHSSHVAKECSHVHWLGGIILGEGLDASADGSAALSWEESEGAVAGSFKLSVRLEES